MASSGLRQLAERERTRAEIDGGRTRSPKCCRVSDLAADGTKLDQSLARLDRLLARWERATAVPIAGYYPGSGALC
jgi:hypothetical protein